MAEHVLERLQPWFPHIGPPWTARAALPGGEPAPPDKPEWRSLPAALLEALRLRHGSRAPHVLLGVDTPARLGRHFGANLFAREVDYMIGHEWAQTGDDVLLRRSKAGLTMTPEERAAVDAYVCARRPSAAAKALVR